MRVPLPEPVISSAPDLSRPLTDSLSVESAAGSFRIKQLRLNEGPSQGVELLLIESDRVRAAICPTRGMSLWKANIDGIPVGWNSPVPGPIHPSYVPLQESSGLGWLDGFDELLVRCGLRSFGAPDVDPSSGQLLYPLHGRIGNLPARELQVRVDPEHSLLEVSATVFETRFLQFNLQLQAKYSIAFGAAEIGVHDRVVNASASAADMQLLYHINVGRPLLDAGSRLHLSCDRVVARNEHAASDIKSWHTYLPPTAGYEEQVYFSRGIANEKGWSLAVLEANQTQGFAVHYQTESLPYFTQWKNTVAESDGYVTGLEPGTGFPNPRSFEAEQGRLVRIEAHSALDFHLKLEGISDAGLLQARIAATQAAVDAIATAEFDAAWCTPRE